MNDSSGFSVQVTLAFTATSEQTNLQALLLLLLTKTLPLIRQLSYNASPNNSWQADLNPPHTHYHYLRKMETNPLKRRPATPGGITLCRQNQPLKYTFILREEQALDWSARRDSNGGDRCGNNCVTKHRRRNRKGRRGQGLFLRAPRKIIWKQENYEGIKNAVWTSPRQSCSFSFQNYPPILR